MVSDVLRKAMLCAEIGILISSLNEAGVGASPLPTLSKEEMDKMDVSDLEGLKRELRDLSRSLGGAKGR